MKKYYRKKIIVNKQGNFIWAYIFKNIDEMRTEYKKMCPMETGHEVIGAVCINREYFKANKVKDMKKINKMKHTGYVLTCLDYVGAGVVSHEFMHAVFFANGISKVKFKKQYPIVINNMKEEETLLYAFTDAVKSYYKWYWKLKDSKKI